MHARAHCCSTSNVQSKIGLGAASNLQTDTGLTALRDHREDTDVVLSGTCPRSLLLAALLYASISFAVAEEDAPSLHRVDVAQSGYCFRARHA